MSRNDRPPWTKNRQITSWIMLPLMKAWGCDRLSHAMGYLVTECHHPFRPVAAVVDSNMEKAWDMASAVAWTDDAYESHPAIIDLRPQVAAGRLPRWYGNIAIVEADADGGLLDGAEARLPWLPRGKKEVARDC